MDELINVVSQRTGVAADIVRTVLTAAAEFIKQKLPPQLAGQIDLFEKGGGGNGGPGSNPNPIGTLAGLLGGS